MATEQARQRFLQALGTLNRTESENVRYVLNPDSYHAFSTRDRQADSVSAAELRKDKVYFHTGETKLSLSDEQKEFYAQATEPATYYRHFPIKNAFDFKTSLNAAIADAGPEKRFIEALLAPANLPSYDAWIKSTAIGFYEIDYAWKKGEHPKRGKFNPDFFIKAGGLILVIEIKDDDQLREPSDENRKKNEYARAHFEELNRWLAEQGSPIHYQFHFLAPSDFGPFFAYLQRGDIRSYRSGLDVKLVEESE